jgi:hypothetical protein
LKKSLVFLTKKNLNLYADSIYLSHILNGIFTDNFKDILFKKYDILIIYNSSLKSLPAIICTKILKKKILYCFHEPFYSFEELVNWKLKFFKYLIVNFTHYLCCRLIDKAVVFSNYGNKKLKKIAPKNLNIIISGLPYKDNFSDYKVKSEKIKISYLGGITQFKNPYIFIDKYSEYFNEYNIEYHIYSKTKKNINNEHIHIHEQKLSDKEFIEVIKSSDIIHIPHDFCTQSGVLVRSFSVGRPVIINNTDNYNYEKQIDGVCGIIDDEYFLDKFVYYMKNREKFALSAYNYYINNFNINSDYYEL